jgi:hypothetical protein
VHHKIPQKTEKKKTVLLSILTDGRKLKPFATMKRNNIPKEKKKKKNPSGITFKCNEKG